MEFPGVEVSPYLDHEYKVARFDLSLFFQEKGGALIGRINYSTDLFDRGKIKRISKHFKCLLASIVKGGFEKVKNLPLLTDRELKTVLIDWNNTESDFPKDKTIHGLFEEQVVRTPNAIAAVFDGQRLTYQDLNKESNQLARYLSQQCKNTVNPDSLILLCLDRSLDMIVSIIAILKLGAAYVPIDPGYPGERIQYIFEDTQAALLLTQSHLLEHLPFAYKKVNLDEAPLAKQPADNFVSRSSVADLAYVIYSPFTGLKPPPSRRENLQILRYHVAHD